ncbi:MAG: hypothetical protein E6J64_14210 [Deltaproteobacteria bacterium]|nr:MAG: hypothetical protein E6J64_14210 [Deltaproteobacteria bacterium]
MKRVAPFALALIGFAAFAQTTQRVRGTITGLEGDVLTVKSRDGKEVRVQLAPDTQVAVAKATTLAEIKPGTYVGSAAVKRADGTLVAKEVHTLGPQVPAGHIAWDLEPGSTMTNANLAGTAKAAGGQEITLQYKDGTQKILVPPGTPIVTFVPGDRAALKPGETIFTTARVEEGGKLSTQRIQVSKDGVRPAH